jgi:FkbM family methyltransferase
VRRSKVTTRLLRAPAALPAGALRARLYRSVSWPVAQRLRAERTVKITGGGKMVVRTDDLLGRVLAISGVYEPNVTAAFTSLVEPGGVVLDVGAHIGYYTVVAANLVGEQGHVHAFEPSPANHRRLQMNIELNAFDNVTTHELAVGEQQGNAVLYESTGQNSGLATLHAELAGKSGVPAREVTVGVAPVASVVPESDLRRVRVIKIDVEWHELEVLRSLEVVFEAADRIAVFVEWTPHKSAPEAPDQFRELCESHGFTMYGLGSGHSLERLFPDGVDEPVGLDDIPAEQTDLLLLR